MFSLKKVVHSIHVQNLFLEKHQKRNMAYQAINVTYTGFQEGFSPETEDFVVRKT